MTTAKGEMSYQKYLDILNILKKIDDQQICHEFCDPEFCLQDETENIARILNTIEFKVKLKSKSNSCKKCNSSI